MTRDELLARVDAAAARLAVERTRLAELRAALEALQRP